MHWTCAWSVVQAYDRYSDGEGQNRTADTAIFSRVLYQLSYLAGTAPGAVQRKG
jgi:hypothetical protein